MKNLLAKLEDVCEKADYLSQRTEELVATNRSLRIRVAELEKELAGESQSHSDLQNQYKILKLARSMDGENGNEKADELKKKINEYIREIDQCLKLIGD